MKQDYFKEERLEYEEIEVPDELLYRVRKTIAENRKKQAARRKAYIIKMAGAIAAVLFLSLSVGVNSSYEVAETVVKIPVVNTVAKAVVMRNYRSQIIEVYETYKISKHPEKTPEEISETPLEEVVSTESGNDEVVQEMVQPTVAQPIEQPAEEPAKEPVKETEKIELWKAEMTLEKLKEVTELYTSKMEEKYAETPEKLRTILLAELEEKDISLYGYHEDKKLTGVVLRIGDTQQYFDWTYMKENGKLPEVSCNDIDGDGTEEVVILLYNEKQPKKETVTENDTVSGTEVAEEAKTTGVSAGEVDTKDVRQTEKTAGSATEKQSTEGKATTTSATEKQNTEGKAATTSATEKQSTEGKAATTSATEKPSTEGKTTTVSGGNAEKTDKVEKTEVSGNDAASEKQQVGEVWIVTTKEGEWAATRLSVKEYEEKLAKQKEKHDKGTVSGQTTSGNKSKKAETTQTVDDVNNL